MHQDKKSITTCFKKSLRIFVAIKEEIHICKILLLMRYNILTWQRKRGYHLNYSARTDYYLCIAAFHKDHFSFFWYFFILCLFGPEGF